MNILSTRIVALIGIGSAVLVALPPAYSMNVMERIITTQTQFIRHEASEHQRKVAEANARAYMAAQLRSYRRHASHDTDSKPEKTSKTAKTEKPGKSGKTGHTAKHDEEVDTTPAKHHTEKEDDVADRKAMKKKLPRYVAIDTVKDKRSAPGTKKDVMIWDTQAETLVGNNVYDVQNPPAVGSTTKFETYSAQYVGTGL